MADQPLDLAGIKDDIAGRFATPGSGGSLMLDHLVACVAEIERLREVLADHPEKWSFDTLMWAADQILAERYPPEVFTGVSGDPGPRLAVALRDCRAIIEKRETPASAG